jgi:hypothetical protein
MKRNSRKTSKGGRSSASRPALTRGAILLQRLVSDANPSFQAWHTREPRLIFAGGARVEDPKTGLTMYGPAELEGSPRSSLRLGVIGTGDTISLLKGFLERGKGWVHAGRDKRGYGFDPVMFPSFPGFAEDSPFACRMDVDERLCETLTDREIDSAISSDDFSARVRGVVELVGEKFAVLADRDPQPDVVICAMPEKVDLACGPQGRVDRRVKALTPAQKAQRKFEQRAGKAGQMLLDFGASEDDGEGVKGFWDFHNAMKVRAMAFGMPTQLVWESTLSGSRDTQDPATMAWNFFTAVYYKAGNVPWKLDFDTSGTCFVGVTFYRESPDPHAATRTSLAQVFSESGEGLVLKGEQVSWDKDRDRKPHLTAESAARITTQALSLYQQHFGQIPTRVVVHKTSRYWPEEQEGFRAALASVKSFDLLALDRRGIRFLRLGKEPPIRGTVIQLARRNYLVYTRGYVPFLRAYPGMRIPNPLEVVEHLGDSSADKVCSEILALTKLNWNNCGFASGSPITTAFSKQVGRILTELPEGVVPQTKYRYFM